MKKTAARNLSLFLALILTAAAGPLSAAMALDKIIVYLDDTPNARDDIVVTNPDAENLYLQTEIYRVDNPGTPEEKRVRVVDPREFKLLVSPSKAVIGPGEQKRFRLMSLERNLDTEKVYRVTFKPVVGDIKTDRTALKILVAYQALVFVQPQDGQFQLQLVREGDRWQLRNSGNVNVEIASAQHCEGEGRCSDISLTGRVYAGTSLPLEADLQGGYLSLLARSAGNTEKLRIPVAE
ncbi:fimbrial biogenesis chaperone [Microbulbifer guangxiensis]|uniref:fimbrial biogenesis chaperone n=1 Tax=Microbulbifer guangxiensis TaxID=2904249 RepID=UPI001F02912B|nr:fimbria/pilus periplasmic chaperone [Microbulbifer guangxiensis]